jgi:GxxExxY protein
MELNQISAQIIAAALKIHSAIGPGVLESVYQTCMVHELKTAGLAVQSQIVLPVIYECLHLDSATGQTSWWRTQ